MAKQQATESKSPKSFFDQSFSKNEPSISFGSSVDTYEQPHTALLVQNPERVGNGAVFEWMPARFMGHFQQGWLPYPSQHMGKDRHEADLKDLPWLKIIWEDRNGQVTIQDGAHGHLVLCVTSANMRDKVLQAQKRQIQRSAENAEQAIGENDNAFAMMSSEEIQGVVSGEDEIIARGSDQLIIGEE